MSCRELIVKRDIRAKLFNLFSVNFCSFGMLIVWLAAFSGVRSIVGLTQRCSEAAVVRWGSSPLGWSSAVTVGIARAKGRWRRRGWSLKNL